MKFEIYTPQEARESKKNKADASRENTAREVIRWINDYLTGEEILIERQWFCWLEWDAHWVIEEMESCFAQAGWSVEKVYQDEGFWIWKSTVFKGWKFTPLKDTSK